MPLSVLATGGSVYTFNIFVVCAERESFSLVDGPLQGVINMITMSDPGNIPIVKNAPVKIN